jgi:K+-sensing histidine kinase KdpD
MPVLLILAVVAMGLVLAVLAVVVVGIRQEPSSQELTRQAPRLMAKMTRRLVGVYVRRPDPCVIPENQGKPSHAAHGLARRAD